MNNNSIWSNSPVEEQSKPFPYIYAALPQIEGSGDYRSRLLPENIRHLEGDLYKILSFSFTCLKDTVNNYGNRVLDKEVFAHVPICKGKNRYDVISVAASGEKFLGNPVKEIGGDRGADLFYFIAFVYNGICKPMCMNTGVFQNLINKGIMVLADSERSDIEGDIKSVQNDLYPEDMEYSYTASNEMRDYQNMHLFPHTDKYAKDLWHLSFQQQFPVFIGAQDSILVKKLLYLRKENSNELYNFDKLKVTCSACSSPQKIEAKDEKKKSKPEPIPKPPPKLWILGRVAILIAMVVLLLWWIQRK